MKDEQIIKALECCATDDGDDCFQCPYGNIVYKPGNGGCVNRCRKDAIDLINLQKAEIGRLAAKILVKDNINNYNTAQLRIAREELRTAKSEAIKEFAEKLKKRFYLSAGRCVVDVYHIDNLVKEMTEGNNENHENHKGEFARFKSLHKR